MAQALIVRRGGSSDTKVPLGISWAYGQSNPNIIRRKASENLSATACIGSSGGSSDFDNYPIYKDIKTCNLANDGTVNAYLGDVGFIRDGSNGQVMVEIPKFWYNVIVDTTNTTITYFISDKELVGYTVHPMFLHNGLAQSHIYIGAYKTGADYTSRTEVTPLVNYTRSATRNGIVSARGSGWSMCDLTVRSGVAMLMSIEYATFNFQTAIGSGVSNVSSARNTGGTDDIVYHTGRESGTDTSVSCRWRGIEDWWGNVREWIDGLNFNGGTFYYCLNQSNFADNTATNYTALSYTVGTSLSNDYGTRLGYDSSAKWSLLPSVHVGGTSSTYLCDATSTTAGWNVAATSGGWLDNVYCGAYYWRFNIASSAIATVIGSRLMYVP